MFEPFYDPENSAICVHGAATVEDINRQASGDGLYWPLYLREDLPLVIQLQCQPFTSRSFRFGANGDNILGMNFNVNGSRVSIGGRTIKNVCGYDYTRFLAHSQVPFSRIEHLVLRLRPLPSGFSVWRLDGEYDALNAFRQVVLFSPWSGAINAFDAELLDGRLCFFMEFPLVDRDEWVLVHWLESEAFKFGIKISQQDALPQSEAVPTAKVKTTLSQFLPEAMALSRQFKGRIYGYLGNGFFQFQPEVHREDDSGLNGYLQALHERTALLGGQVEAPGLEYEKDRDEKEWERVLMEAWRTLE